MTNFFTTLIYRTLMTFQNYKEKLMFHLSKFQKKENKNSILIIADCLEADYLLYKKLYMKLARRFGFKKENVFILTEKSFKQPVSLKRENDVDIPLASYLIKSIVKQKAKAVYSLCNIKRKEAFEKIFDKAFIDSEMRNQYFGYYTSVFDVEEHYITKMLVSKTITKDDVVSTTNLTPNKEYLEELTFALEYSQIKFSRWPHQINN